MAGGSLFIASRYTDSNTTGFFKISERSSVDLSFIKKIDSYQGIRRYYYAPLNTWYTESSAYPNFASTFTSFGKYLYYNGVQTYPVPGGAQTFYTFIYRNKSDLILAGQKDAMPDNQSPSIIAGGFSSITNDRRYLYILKGDYLIKYDIYDFSINNYVQIEAPNPKAGLSTDGIYLYYVNRQSGALYKYRCSDLSIMAGSTIGDQPTSTATDGEHVYVTVRDVGSQYPTISMIRKFRCSDLGAVQNYGTVGSGDNQFNLPFGITTDNTYLYIADYSNNRIKKHLCSDLSYVSKIGSYGDGDDQFVDVSMIHYSVFSGALPVYRPDLI